MMPSSDKLTIHEMTQLGVLLAAAIALRLAETSLAWLLPLPGAHLGLANTVTIIVLYLYGPGKRALFLTCRILLTGLLFTGLLTPGFLIGLGGGSPQDTCKGIGIITANPEFADVLSLEGVADTKNPSVPIFGVPTTAGTASETTINYVVTDTANKRKFVAVDPHDIPIVAFVDPDLTDTMPRGLKVATGLDALTHAIEGYITPGAWSLSDCLSMQTIRMIAKNLAKSADGDVPAGEQMAYASYITGMAYSNVGLGLVHGMAHPLGGRLGVAHGVANGILLAPVMEYNKDFTGEKYRDIADAFGIEDAYTGDLEKVREEAVQAVHQLTVDLKNPTTISEVGATEADLAPLAHDAFNDVCTPGNPRKATEEDILKIYTSLM